MASNILSRLLPSTSDDRSVYELMQEDERNSQVSDAEDAAGMALDEDNLGQRFQDQDLEELLAGAAHSQINSDSPTASPTKSISQRQPNSLPTWTDPRPQENSRFEDDDDVPESLLLGENTTKSPNQPPAPQVRGTTIHNGLPTPVPGPSTDRVRAQWQAARKEQRLDNDPRHLNPASKRIRQGWNAFVSADPKERAMWRWINVQNLDSFLNDVYQYFLGHGIWSILLSRILNLLTLAFVVSLIAFLGLCIDYGKIPESKTLPEVIIPHCTKNMSGLSSFVLWVITLIWVFKLFEYIVDVRRLWNMHEFYHHLLDIPDYDIQTVSWQIVVARLMALRDANPITAQNVSAGNRRFLGHQSKQRMDAHDIANRIMRKENYLIALFNKDILDLTMPVPFLGKRQFFSKAVEWNINLCVIEYVFNEQGQVKHLFLKDQHRRALVDGLHLRFKFAAVMSIITAPIMVIGLLALYFLRYFMEFKMNPSQLSSRGFTPLAEWKFREFNELWHLFDRRTNMAYPYASRYLDQFPKDKTFQLYRFVAFIAGALAAVLFIATLFDTEDFLGFEITPNKTAIFYMGVLGTIHVAARSAVPEENLVLDPEYALQNVIECTHYYPASWRGQLHSDEVRREFSQLYQLKALTFLEEMMSLLFTPVILWFSLPKCSARIVDFFREFTIHVDGLGHVCSFAVFDFKKGGDNTAQAKGFKAGGDGLREDYYSSKDGKLLASYYGFLDNYATNPTRGAIYPRTSSNRHFHPPPPFPGLMSPTLAAEVGMVAGRGPPGPQAAQRTPRLAPPAGRASPIQSMLLDAHHQPTASDLRSSPHRMMQSRYRPPRQPLPDYDEHYEDDRDRATARGGVASSRIIEEDSNLGDSWRTSRAAQLDGEAAENEIETEAGPKGAGVLGLLYQLQKAQTDGRATGVRI